MPGIFGILSADTSLDKAGAERCIHLMTDMLSHQPWYGKNHFAGNRCGFGSVSVGNSASLEELSFRGKRFIVLIDGYVYSIDDDQVETFENVSEKVLEHFTDHRSRLNTIRGSYTIGIYDVGDRTFSLFNDRVGPRRIYYAHLGELLVFSPEVKGISCLPQFEKKVDWLGVADLLNHGYLLGEKTLFKNIKSFPSGGLLEFDQGKNAIGVHRYSKPAYCDSDRSFEDTVENGLILLRKSVSEKVDRSDSVICPISGGLDSRIILSTLRQVNDEVPVKPLTYGQRFSYEYKNAVNVCKALGYDNHSLVSITPDVLLDKYKQAVWLSEGMIPMTNGHLLLLPRAIGGDFRFLLNGIYGGPTNYGAEYYRRDHIDFGLGFESKVEDIMKVLSVSPDGYEGILPQLSSSLKDAAFESISTELKEHLDASDRFCDQRDAFFIENRMRRCINQSALYRFFWEEHLPLSNYELYDFYLSTNPEMKLEKKLLRAMIRKGFPEMARIGEAQSGLNLYQKAGSWYQKKNSIKKRMTYYINRYGKGRIVSYDKTAYVHYPTWFQSDKKTFDAFHGFLFDSSMIKDGIYDKDGLSSLFTRTKDTGLYFTHVIRLITLSVWYELFIQNRGMEDLKGRLIKTSF